MTHPLPMVGRVASLLVASYRSRQTFFLVQRLSGELLLKGTKRSYLH
jgi:hypothetical protein